MFLELQKSLMRRIRRYAGYDPCFSTYAEEYFNRVDVRRSLHANVNGRWSVCKWARLPRCWILSLLLLLLLLVFLQGKWCHFVLLQWFDTENIQLHRLLCPAHLLQAHKSWAEDMDLQVCASRSLPFVSHDCKDSTSVRELTCRSVSYACLFPHPTTHPSSDPSGLLQWRHRRQSSGDWIKILCWSTASSSQVPVAALVPQPSGPQPSASAMNDSFDRNGWWMTDSVWPNTWELCSWLQVGGRFVEYQGLTMVTVRGAGHLVPLNKPQEALVLINSYLRNQQLPTHKWCSILHKTLQSNSSWFREFRWLSKQKITARSLWNLNFVVMMLPWISQGFLWKSSVFVLWY